MRGATKEFDQMIYQLTISIHAPHAGCDRIIKSVKGVGGIFQSTHPMRGATDV